MTLYTLTPSLKGSQTSIKEDHSEQMVFFLANVTYYRQIAVHSVMNTPRGPLPVLSYAWGGHDLVMVPPESDRALSYFLTLSQNEG